jgi:hypothetical protein
MAGQMRSAVSIFLLILLSVTVYPVCAKPVKQNKSCVNPRKLILPEDNYKGKKCPKPRKIKNAKYY